MDANKAPELPARRWRLRLEVDELESKVATAIDEAGTIIGLATAGATRDPDAPTAWELYSINVSAAHHGTGVADRLIAAVMGERPATLWAAKDNHRAHAFYRRHGFSDEGANRVHESSGAPEIRMISGQPGNLSS